MKKVVLIFSLIVIAVGLYNHNQNKNMNIIPEFTDEQLEFICNEESL